MPDEEQGVARSARARIVAVRLTQQERDTFWRFAEERGVDPSKMLRGMILDLTSGAQPPVSDPSPGPASGNGGAMDRIPVGGPAGPPPPLPRSWAKEWAAMEGMEPSEAGAHFARVSSGVKVPGGFRSWSRAEKIAWLDKECPLC